MILTCVSGTSKVWAEKRESERSFDSSARKEPNYTKYLVIIQCYEWLGPGPGVKRYAHLKRASRGDGGDFIYV